jgi:DNA invertase Pin-like site-specific DNA recombinase
MPKRVDFIVIDQSKDTTTPAGRLTFHLLGTVSEFERDLIAARRSEGIEKAKANGVKFGRREKLKPEQVEDLRTSARAGEPRTFLMQRFGISKSTFYRLCSVDNLGD